MASSAKSNRSKSGSGPQSAKSERQDKTRSNTSTSKRIFSPSAHTSFTEVIADFTTINETQSPASLQLNTRDENTPYRYTTNSPLHQQHDLLGLSLQPSVRTAPNCEDTSFGGLLSVDEDRRSTCPTHSNILLGADDPIIQGAERKLPPMERYLAEGLSERYALVNVVILGSELQWARYKDCSCEESQQQ